MTTAPLTVDDITTVDDAFGDDDAGLLTSSARDAAIAACLPLLGTYFSTGAQMGLVTRDALRVEQPSSDTADDWASPQKPDA